MSDIAVHDWQKQLARPLDRLAAVIADLLLALPVIAVFSAPFRRHATEAQMIGSDENWIAAWIGVLAVTVILLIVYQTVFLALWGVTPGKRFMGLRVVSIWRPEDRLRPQQALVRSCGFVLELVLFCMPLVALLGDTLRRSFHDRLAETVVVSVRPERVASAPSSSEHTVALGLQAAAFLAVAIVCSSTIWSRLHRSSSPTNEKGAAEAANKDEANHLCAIVSQAHQEWLPLRGEATPSRLSVALTLYAAGRIELDCLSREADLALWSAHQDSLDERASANLAKGLVEFDHNKQAKVYFDRACEESKNSDACRMGQFLLLSYAQADAKSPEARLEAQEPAGESTQNESVQNDADEAADRIALDHKIETLVDTVTEQSAPFARVWVASYLYQTSRESSGEGSSEAQRRDRSMRLIDDLAHESMLAGFTASQRARILWANDRKSEARVAIQSALELGRVDQKLEDAQWICEREIEEHGCTADAERACRVLASVVDRSAESLERSEILVTNVRGEACLGSLNVKRIDELNELVASQDQRDYLAAVREATLQHGAEARQAFQKLSINREAQELLQNEASVRLIELANSASELEPLRAQWLKFSSDSDGWQRVGRKLIERLSEFKNWRSAVEVGLAMSNTQRLDTQSKKSVVVAAFHAGDKKLARDIVQSLNAQSLSAQNLNPGSLSDGFEKVAADGQRQPASVSTASEYDVVLRQLNSAGVK